MQIITVELHLAIQFHRQFLITYSDFWMVNILLRKFGTSAKKEMKMIKHKCFDEKQQNAKKVYVNL